MSTMNMVLRHTENFLGRFEIFFFSKNDIFSEICNLINVENLSKIFGNNSCPITDSVPGAQSGWCGIFANYFKASDLQTFMLMLCSPEGALL